MSWELFFTRQAQKDAKKVSSTNLRSQVEKLFEIWRVDPFQKPPRVEKLVGDLAGAYSRRINVQHRVVYPVPKNRLSVKVIRMRTHHE